MLELIEIAQLVTGLATLIVASVLIWQMIIQKRTLDIAHNENHRWFSESLLMNLLKK